MAIQTDKRGALGFVARQGAIRFEPQRVNNALLKVDVSNIAGLSGNDENVLVLSIASFPIPKVSSTVITGQYLNTESKFAGRASVEALSLVYRDYVDVATADALEIWRRAVFNPDTGEVGYASDYKVNGSSELLGPDLDADNARLANHFRFFRLEGCWPSLVDRGDIDMAGDDQVFITATIEIDMSTPVDNLNLINA